MVEQAHSEGFEARQQVRKLQEQLRTAAQPVQQLLRELLHPKELHQEEQHVEHPPPAVRPHELWRLRGALQPPSSVASAPQPAEQKTALQAAIDELQQLLNLRRAGQQAENSFQQWQREQLEADVQQLRSALAAAKQQQKEQQEQNTAQQEQLAAASAQEQQLQDQLAAVRQQVQAGQQALQQLQASVVQLQQQLGQLEMLPGSLQALAVALEQAESGAAEVTARYQVSVFACG
jgi:hypothetical protein